MADPSSEKPDQPAASEGRKPEDAAARLNQILSSPLENPFAAEAQAPTESAAREGGRTPEPARPEVSQGLPPDLAAWEGAKTSPAEGAPEANSAPPPEPVSAESPAPPPGAEPAPAATPSGAPDAGAARVIAKVRSLMVVSTVLTALAIAAVFGIIGYRVFKGEGRPDAPTQATLTLPPGARIVQTAIAEDRLVLTLQVGSAFEIRTYDLKTLKPLGRLNFSTVP